MDNLKEFKELILLYESISLEQLEEKAVNTFMSNIDVLENITGFGSLKTCKLCTAIGAEFIDLDPCNKCTWKIKTNHLCTQGVNRTTYYDIDEAETLKDLLDAVHNRADYMRNVINWFEDKI